MEPKGEKPGLPRLDPGAESSFGFGVWCEGNLPATFCEVQDVDEPSSSQALDEVTHSRQGVAVKLRYLVQLLEVIMYAKTSTGFGKNDDGAGPVAAGLRSDIRPVRAQ